MAETLEALFEGTGYAPVFEQVFGCREPRRVPTRCCVTGAIIRKPNAKEIGSVKTRYKLAGTPFFVFATKPLTTERLAALTAIASAASKGAKVKEASNG